jgi:hypothetical protein
MDAGLHGASAALLQMEQDIVWEGSGFTRLKDALEFPVEIFRWLSANSCNVPNELTEFGARRSQLEAIDREVGPRVVKHEVLDLAIGTSGRLLAGESCRLIVR